MLVDRARPESGDDPRLRAGDSHSHEENSFPSGHSAGVVAVAPVIAHSYPEQAGVARAVALSLSAIQVPRGAHYVGDVIAGVVIGIAVERVSNATIYPVLTRESFAIVQ